MSTLAQIIAPAEDRWPSPDEVPDDAIGQLLLASHLLGANRAIANFGGGNTSCKGVATDHLGRAAKAMWVKGSGSDLHDLRASDLTPLRLDEAVSLFQRDEMSDGDMVSFLGRCQLDPGAPRSSIETLLHAFIPAAHVHHTHPDAINALAGTVEGARLLAECFGEEAAWIPYQRPGFALARQVGTVVRDDPALRLVVLAKHGLVVWGDSAEDAYRRTIEVINRSAEFINARTAGQPRFGGPRRVVAAVDDDAGRQALLHEILPVLRGAVSSQRPKILATDCSDRVQEFVASRDATALAGSGAACPDHLVHTKRTPLWIPFDPGVDDADALKRRIRELAEQFRSEYRSYFARHAEGREVSADPDARVVLIQHVGMIGVGASVGHARLARDLYQRAIEVMAGAHALGGFTSLSERESFDVEYWPLELFKLTRAPAPGELAGMVAVVTGAAGGIGRSIVAALAAAGACVVAFDIDGEGAAEAVGALAERGIAVEGDVTREDAVGAAFATAVDAFGGCDIAVSNAGLASSAPIEDTTLAEWERIHAVLGTGYFLVARSAFTLLRAQDLGGSVIVIASKNAVVAGRNAVAYSSAKAAELHLARCLAEEGGPIGIRVNTVNPDAVLQGSRIWSSSWREQRAASYGIAPEELEDHYRDRTTLGVNVLPEDVAQAVLHFASPARSGKSTGNMLNVDGGVAAAYPR